MLMRNAQVLNFARYNIMAPFNKVRLIDFIFMLLPVVSVLSLVSAQAGQVVLEWNPNTEPVLGGYIVYYGQESKNYSSSVDVGNQTSFTLYDLVDGKTYYFAVTAYNYNRTFESGFSNEVSTIITPDNPSPNPVVNTPVTSDNPPINTNILLTNYYHSILGRDPDASGITFWQGEISRVQGLGIDAQEAFRVMSSQFFTSDEYLRKNTSDTQYVIDLYSTFLNRLPDAEGLNYWTGELTAGMPRSVVLFTFMFMPEFTNYMRGFLGNTGGRSEVSAVVGFYQGFLNRLPDTDGFIYWLGRFRTAQCQSVAAVYAEVKSISDRFATSIEYLSRNRNNQGYVSDLYYAFLQRGGDLAGLNFWVSQLDANLKTRQQLRQEFIEFPEFQDRVQQISSETCLN